MNDSRAHSIADFYDTSNVPYSFFAYNAQSLALHYGFWDEKTKNHHEAMCSEDDGVMTLAGVKKMIKFLMPVVVLVEKQFILLRRLAHESREFL